MTLFKEIRKLQQDRDDLLEALEDLVSLAESAMYEAGRTGADYDIDGELEDARAAIAKAKGALK